MTAPLNPDEGPGTLRRFVLPGLFVLLLFALLIWRQGPTVVALQGDTMGTTYSVRIVGESLDGKKPDAALAKVLRETLEGVDARMSTYQNSSELMKFNDSETGQEFAASKELVDVVLAAQEVSKASQGAFDVTVGPLVNAYGFGPNKGQEPPTQAELDVLRQKVGYGLVEVDAENLTLKKTAPVFVDLSAIAKGYGVDKVAAALDEVGYRNYLVEVGGEVRARGVNERDKPWELGIEKPDSETRGVTRRVYVSDQSLATSGDYRNYYEKDGKRISHTIDARTGLPITHRVASVSVVHANCMMADAWATAFNVLGDEEGLKIANEQGIAVLFLVRAADGDSMAEVESDEFKRLYGR